MFELFNHIRFYAETFDSGKQLYEQYRLECPQRLFYMIIQFLPNQCATNVGGFI